MTGIVDFALSKAKTTLALALVIIIAGSYARSSLGVAAEPNSIASGECFSLFRWGFSK